MALLLVLAACALTSFSQSSGGVYNFLAIGDWGGQSIVNPPVLPGQVACAKGMDTVAQLINSSFVLAMGDNFYDEGIRTNEYDSRFKSTFEDVYTFPSLQTPWLILAGNHDHYGNVSAEIAYSSLSPRWHFPNYYYNKIMNFTTSTGEAKTIEIVVIDTVILAGNTDHAEGHAAAPPGPENVFMAESEWAWINQTLANSTADYLIVTGHYPVWSVCEHGPTSVLVSTLRPMLIQNNVTLYASGHDHCLEYLDDDSGVVYVLSGAGDMCCYNSSNLNAVPTGSLKFLISAPSLLKAPIESGFVSFRFFDNYLNVVYHDEHGNDLYTTPNILPRK